MKGKIQPIKRSIGQIVAVFLAAGWLAACQQQGQPSMQGQQTPDVDVLVLQPDTVLLEKKYPGAVEGSVNVDIKAQVTGYLDHIYVKEGDYVKKGQSLFRIKGDVFYEQVNNNKAALQSALAAEENARIELEKIKPLVAGEVIAKVQLQTAEASYAAAKAQVAQAKAALGSSQLNADFSLIKAPVSGYIGRIPNRIGNLVTPADAVPLTSLSEINEVYVYFSMSEADFIAFVRDRKANEGINTVEIIMADGSVYNHKGKLELASGNIERSTGSMALKAIFPNPDQLLRAGGSAKVILRKQLTSVLSVPMSSVRDIQDKYFVFAIADSNKVSMKSIEITGNAGNSYIVKAGLQPGEKIALNRIDMLNEGMTVAPANATAAEPKQ
ncbi:MAG: efflux RND transporter periplasmic adaptor subunit [Candidatus Pseudobacter hemicellulosilyticus]|uniref:Efflux RND transporter periplasmic adaptor subunit n=1 Tax=Candidatus Pseudobacter hemicellulosilyticus TaxID=3121375 RepID=A0AAJ6BJK2_9BACT|nr:MAG: efflux RND transporter periplasmic adaptor subunit [Pseudobacter sp.]